MFWDSSALVPLLVREAASAALTAVLADDARPAMWWGTPVECASAIYRRHHHATIASPLLRQAFTRLDAIVADAAVVLPTDELQRRTRRLLASHSLRAGDSLQLAAALLWCDDFPVDEGFVCLDSRLRDAAAREGFHVLPE